MEPQCPLCAGRARRGRKVYEEVTISPQPVEGEAVAARHAGPQPKSRSAEQPVSYSVGTQTDPTLLKKAVPQSSRAAHPATTAMRQGTLASTGGRRYVMPAFSLGTHMENLRYGELVDARISHTRFYAHHKTLPIAAKPGS